MTRGWQGQDLKLVQVSRDCALCMALKYIARDRGSGRWDTVRFFLPSLPPLLYIC